MSLLQQEQILAIFCLYSCRIDSCMGALSSGEIYKTGVGSNEGDLSLHTSQTVCFSKMNEDRSSDRESLLDIQLSY